MPAPGRSIKHVARHGVGDERHAFGQKAQMAFQNKKEFSRTVMEMPRIAIRRAGYAGTANDVGRGLAVMGKACWSASAAFGDLFLVIHIGLDTLAVSDRRAHDGSAHISFSTDRSRR